MPSNSKPKIEIPLQLVTERGRADKAIITVGAENADRLKAKGKEEAGEPLYLKRI